MSTDRETAVYLIPRPISGSTDTNFYAFRILRTGVCLAPNNIPENPLSI